MVKKNPESNFFRLFSSLIGHYLTCNNTIAMFVDEQNDIVF